MGHDGVNILMLNPVHPSVPHVSGVRAWRFSQELALLGHRVALITAPMDGSSAVDADIAGHDWTRPLVIACHRMGEPSQGISGNVLFRKSVTAMRLLQDGGADGAWGRAAVRWALRAGGIFDPDVIWCTFGQGESVIATRRIAEALGRPWVLDIKDNWELYVPRGLRRLMAWRTRGASAIVANARLTADMASKWQKAKASIVYSGVEEAFYQRPGSEGRDSRFVLNLVGSVYSRAQLERFLDGVRLWFARLPEGHRERVAIRYLGGDVEMVNAVAERKLPGMTMDIRGHVPVAEFARHCASAGANAYIAYHATFHHKLLELLATDNPVIAFPNERKESIDLAKSFTGGLHVAPTSEDLARLLGELHAQYASGVRRQHAGPDPRAYSWRDQARLLERVLMEAAHKGNAS